MIKIDFYKIIKKYFKIYFYFYNIILKKNNFVNLKINNLYYYYKNFFVSGYFKIKN